jgi:hypothetical protein
MHIMKNVCYFLLLHLQGAKDTYFGLCCGTIIIVVFISVLNFNPLALKLVDSLVFVVIYCNYATFYNDL